jgi:signal transduction histidine kinase
MSSLARILIAEDHILVAEDMRDGLEAMGYEVVGIAATGEIALDLVASAQPDVVIMDVKLGGVMDGVDAAAAINQRFDIPVLFLSAFSDDKLIARARGVGAFGYLVKPYSLDELHATLEVARFKAQSERIRRDSLRHHQQEQKSESLYRMVGAVAHHYNNMLSVIMGNLELALDGLSLNNKVRGMVHNAYTQTLLATKMGHQMLSCLGQEFRHHYNLDLRELCDGYIRSHGKYQGLQWAAGQEALLVCSNRQDIEHILDVLLVNALEAMNDQAQGISVEVGRDHGRTITTQGRVPLKFEPADGEYAWLEVTDRGCGIPKIMLENIFDPFFTTKFTGRGLGLSTALGVVKSCDGCITVQSEPGKGTRFRVWLPLQA